jgi:hypothetical protein
MRRVSLVAFLAVLAAPAAARAATATVEGPDDPQSPDARAIFTAARGEANHVTVTVGFTARVFPPPRPLDPL